MIRGVVPGAGVGFERVGRAATHVIGIGVVGKDPDARRPSRARAGGMHMYVKALDGP